MKKTVSRCEFNLRNKFKLIFHRGAKKVVQPKAKIIDDKSGLLIWKENDRAVATFKNIGEIEKSKTALKDAVRDWINATK